MKKQLSICLLILSCFFLQNNLSAKNKLKSEILPNKQYENFNKEFKESKICSLNEPTTPATLYPGEKASATTATISFEANICELITSSGQITVSYTLPPGATPKFLWEINNQPAPQGTSLGDYYFGPICNGDEITVTMYNGDPFTGGAFFTNASTTINCDLTVNVKAFIQGFYIGSQQMRPVLFNQFQTGSTYFTDHIVGELYDTSVPPNLIASDSSEIDTNGNVQFLFSNTANCTNYYYIVLKHRNAIQTWSALPQLIGFNYSYDFTTSASQAYIDENSNNDSMVLVEPGVWALYSGDINQDEVIDGLDEQLFANDSFASLFGGYYATDLNGDGVVDGTDSPFLVANILNTVYSQHP